MPAKEVVELLARIGVWDVIVPFILVFTILFAILERTKVLGKDKKRFNAMIAFVIGFFVIALTDVLQAINVLSQYMTVLIVAGLLLMVMLSLLGVKDLHKSNLLKWAVLLLVFGGGLYVMGWLDWIDAAAVNRWIASPVTALIIFLILLWFVFQKGEKKKSEPKPKPVPPPVSR